MITKKDLLKELEERKINIGGNSSRMLTKFISLGLIDKPERFGLGKGKGTVSMFDKNNICKITKIVTLRKKGLTYKQIKEKTQFDDNWVLFANALKIDSIKNIPSLPDSEKGRLLLSSDLAVHLTRVIIDELCDWLREYNPNSNIEKDVFSAVKFSLPEILCNFDLGDEEYQDYINGKGNWGSISPLKKHIAKNLEEDMKKK